MDDLPHNFDAIVVGTGIPESIVAAALARNGHSVLHLERNDYYSGDYATFMFDGLLRWIEDQQLQPISDQSADRVEGASIGVESNEVMIATPASCPSISNLVVRQYIPDRPEPQTSNTVTEGDVSSPENGNNDTGQPLTSAAVQTEPSTSEASGTSDGPVPTLGDQTSELDSPPSNPDPQNLTNVPPDPYAENSPDPPAVSEDTPGADPSPLSDPSDQPGAGTVLAPLPAVPTDREFTMADISSQSRKFNIDISPKVLTARGPMVELLISSNVSRYCEFKAVSRILCYTNNSIQRVPCSRADVFNSKDVSVMDKRHLMRFLTFCVEFQDFRDEWISYSSRPFSQFLTHRSLNDTLRHYIIYGIAMVTPDTPTSEGLQACHKFLKSLGRYGTTPYIWPLYGSGELPQCFCRMCAVFAGIYCLRRHPTNIIVDTTLNKCIGVLDSEGVRLTCNNLVMATPYIPLQLRPVYETHTHSVNRCVLITDRSLQHTDTDQISIISIPVENGNKVIRGLELSPSSYACPKPFHIVHLISEGDGSNTADNLLSPTVDLLFRKANNADYDSETDKKKPRVLWCFYFNHLTSDPSSDLPAGLFHVLSSYPGGSIDYDEGVNEARRIFEAICPGEEFLPPAPNPEDIIIDDVHDNPGHGNHSVTQEAEAGSVSEEPVDVGEENKESLEEGDSD